MSLLENIRKDMLDASKQGDDITVDILKLVIADIRNEQIALDKELTDEDVLKVLRKQEKKIKDSIEQYTKMERDDLVSRESAQLKVIEKYLPSLMSEDEITKIVSRVIADTNASGIQSMGLVMGSVMKELNGKADGNLVKDVVGKLLQSK
ncbi:MAG TPA: GatB/YqeY domain-containing protein [Candidatus Dojkabacteria bacterium]|nr:GatB/YqeY domain-containing protein [Candidatus Dojkabacteria bacterium]